MVYRKLKDEVDAIIRDIPSGTRFLSADIYDQVHHRDATRGAVSHLIKCHSDIEPTSDYVKGVAIIWRKL